MEKLPNDEKNGESATKIEYFGDRKTYKEVSRKRPHGREKETRGGELLHGYKC